MNLKKIQESLTTKLDILCRIPLSIVYDKNAMTKENVTKKDISEYVDLQLGLQIHNCIKKIGHCHFTAEL